jgi:Protein of unknown function (DUF1257)
MTKSAVSIKDIDALETAAKTFGGIFVRNQTTYRWYGRYMGDTPLPEGVKQSDLGKCSHVIKLPNAGYDVGVVQQTDGTFRLMFDYWGPGQELVKTFGTNMEKLIQQYNKAVVVKQAKAKGYFCRTKELPNGAIRLQLVKA